MRRYRLSPQAENDLADIRRYLMQQGGMPLTRYILNEIRDAIRFLATAPGAGHVRRDLTDASVKFWPVFSYLIVYDPETKPLGIARILHGTQNLEALFQRHPPHV